ncbi:MAG: YraN family protein [Bacteroidota bacterium]|nr:YraN family protein [Bacteroidota bacterium]
MAEHNILGKKGEDVAVDYLIGKGYQIRERNWHSSHFELDIIAEYGDWLVIIEVKTRTGQNWEPPEFAVDNRKIRRIVNAAHHYVCLNRLDKPVRFDVISIVQEQGKWNIEHYEDAFLATHA